METFLKNPRHGRKIAYLDLEVAEDKKNGWVEVSEDEYYERNKESDIEEVKKEPIKEASKENATTTGYTGKKRGPKPKNRLTQ